MCAMTEVMTGRMVKEGRQSSRQRNYCAIYCSTIINGCYFVCIAADVPNLNQIVDCLAVT